MPPLKRKASTPLDGQTLHNFFFKPSSGSKKCKLAAEPQFKAKPRAAPSTAEVIVISDSEDNEDNDSRSPAKTIVSQLNVKREEDNVLIKMDPILEVEERVDFGGATVLNSIDEWQTGDDERVNDDDDDDIVDADEVEDDDVQLVEEEESKPTGRTINAFSTLMSSYANNAAWAEADAENARIRARLDPQKKLRPKFKNAPVEKMTRRNAPFYKVLQGMPIAVDAFRYGALPGVTAYFLTHAHSDHYTNLSANWCNGPIYCSEGTGNLIKLMLGVDPKWVIGIPLDVPYIIPDTGGVQVTLIDANHCPGSTLFMFEGPQTINAGDSQFKSPHLPQDLPPAVSTKPTSRVFRYLHCGDFRASPAHVNHKSVKGKKLDVVYLDTTYLDPKYTFAPQAQVISACADLAKRLAKDPNAMIGCGGRDGKTRVMDAWISKGKAKEEPLDGPKHINGTAPEDVLFVVGTYSIGKERIVKAIAHALKSKVYCDDRKASILRCQNDSALDALLTSDPMDAMIHLVPLGACSTDRLTDYIKRMGNRWKRVIGFRPTGWTWTAEAGQSKSPSISDLITAHQSRTYTAESMMPIRNSTPALTLYGVPYSEHSSFVELACFALSCDWARIIATVNVGSESGRNKIALWVKNWKNEKEKRKERGEGIVRGRTDDYW